MSQRGNQTGDKNINRENDWILSKSFGLKSPPRFFSKSILISLWWVWCCGYADWSVWLLLPQFINALLAVAWS